jgi:hypothetical protein
MRALAAPGEERLECFVVDVQAASIGAERGHHRARTIGDQAPPPFAGNTRNRM